MAWNAPLILPPLGSVWQQATPDASFSGDIGTVRWEDSLFILAGDNATAIELQTSPDGRTWTQRTAPTGNYGADTDNPLAAKAGEYMVRGSTNKVRYSSDLSSWATRPAGAETVDKHHIVTNGTRWNTFPNSGTTPAGRYSSDDGVNWSDHTGTVSGIDPSALKYVGSYLLCGMTENGGTSRAAINYSSNGTAFSVMTSTYLPSSAAYTTRDFAYSSTHSKYYACCSNEGTTAAKIYAASDPTDAANWSAVATLSSTKLYAMAEKNGIVIAVGVKSGNICVYYSQDGTNFIEAQVPTIAQTLYGVAAGTNFFCAVGTGGTIIFSY